MSRATVSLCLLVSAGLAWPASPGVRPERLPGGPVLALPGEDRPLRLRLDVVIDGKSPTAAWDVFLERLFDFFDRDGDGWLSRDEVGRTVPLPLPGGKELTIDFARLDADRNGKASRAELKAFCRANGFGPVVAVVEPPSADDLRLSGLLLRGLDADGNGKLTRAELRRAPELLRKYDLNEDESLDPAELLASAAPVPPPAAPRAKLVEAGGGQEVVLRLDLGAKAAAPTLHGPGAKSLRLVAATPPGDLHRLYGPAGRWGVVFRAARTVPDVRSAAEFLLAQFKAAVGDRAALGKAELEQDPGLSGLLGLFRYADRNGDNRLTLAELEDYLRLVELGVRAQVWVRVAEHDRNPFPFLDNDGDGRLSYRELTQASHLIHPDLTELHGLPLQFQLSFGGPSVRSWGGVPIPAVVARPRPAAATPAAPRWFRAMDRNGDGVLSPGEFLGPPALFRKLDENGDGVITPDEATRAGSR
jgi:Ca2+-binding EF-hand superfamily protein